MSGSGSVLFEGTLENAGATLALDDSSLNYFLIGCTIDGGTVVTSNGATLTVNSNGGTLVGTTLDGTLDLATIGGSVMVTNGLTLDGTINLGDANGSTSGQLNFVGADLEWVRLDCSWRCSEQRALHFQRSGRFRALTIAAGVTINGTNGQIGNSSLPLINRGTIMPPPVRACCTRTVQTGPTPGRFRLSTEASSNSTPR